jgi:hypothetical protein
MKKNKTNWVSTVKIIFIVATIPKVFKWQSKVVVDSGAMV